jgi:hypothetical protein
LNRLQEAAYSSIRIYSLLAPTSAEYVDHEQLRQLSDSQKAFKNG